LSKPQVYVNVYHLDYWINEQRVSP